jgi:lysyl-tRNA synthetase class 2
MSDEVNNRQEGQEASLSELLQIRRDKLAELQKQGKDPFQITKYNVTHHSNEVKDRFDELEGQTVSVAGRLMSKRGMGKAVFADLQDVGGRVQLYVRIDDVGEEALAAFKKYDIGDIVGVEGEAFRTKRGEISIKAKTVTLLAKSLLPLPEKFHGLTDRETRYRQRYVDLIMNEDVRRTFQIRTAFIKHVRKYLDDRDYLEVETPVLNTIQGGATARPFVTFHNTLGINMFMRIATELHLKRLTVGGFERVYEIGRIFRNEGMDTKHNPEFTTIELYEAYADFHDMMDIAEGILSSAAKDILGSYQVEWLGETIDLTPGWTRLTMTDAVKQYVGVDFDAVSDDEEACRAAEAAGIDLEGCERTWGTALYECFDQRVEEKLVQPTFITMYPVEVSPLTKRSPADPRLTERFELFINHAEIANAFSELNDPIDQRGRFEHEIALREAGNEEAGMMDDDFIHALEYGMPPTGGMGIGIDRAVMLLTGSDSVRDVILFPTMKPLD